MAKDIDGLEQKLTRHGYNVETLAMTVNAQPKVIRSFRTVKFLADSRIKTVLCNSRQVIPDTAAEDDGGPAWTTLTKSAIKRF